MIRSCKVDKNTSVFADYDEYVQTKLIINLRNSKVTLKRHTVFKILKTVNDPETCSDLAKTFFLDKLWLTKFWKLKQICV